MIFYFAGAKPESKIHPWDNPASAVGEPINVMITYYEFQGKQGKKKRKFLKELKQLRKGILGKKEFWRWIKKYKGYYQVSTFGRVRSCDRTIIYEDGRTTVHKGKILSTTKNKDKYPTVNLWKGNKQNVRTVHTLVLEAFVGPCPKGKEGCHKDDKKGNNHVDNVYWGTPGQNRKDSYKNKCYKNRDYSWLKGENGTFAKLTTKEIKKIRRLWKKAKKKGKTFGLQTKLGKRFNTHRRNIGYIVHNQTRKES